MGSRLSGLTSQAWPKATVSLPSGLASTSGSLTIVGASPRRLEEAETSREKLKGGLAESVARCPSNPVPLFHLFPLLFISLGCPSKSFLCPCFPSGGHSLGDPMLASPILIKRGGAGFQQTPPAPVPANKTNPRKRQVRQTQPSILENQAQEEPILETPGSGKHSQAQAKCNQNQSLETPGSGVSASLE